MADYIYLLETRLSKGQQAALTNVRRVAREHDVTLFLVGGAIRDLISGAPVRDLDVAVQANALKLKGSLEKAGAEISAESAPMQQLHTRFPGGVRLEVSSTLTTTFPKPGRVVVKPAIILDDLRRRDFTANAMALSLNEGSFGLLMDPLNGVADIENRELRLVSNYGFIEDPVRLLRAARLMARLGWRMDERTQSRYDNAKEENYIAAMQPAERAYELEELFHEEDPLRVMRRLEEEGWLKQLSPLLSVAKANVPELGRLRDMQMQLQEQGIVADAAAANFHLLTAKLSPKDTQTIKESFPRKSFVHEIDTLESASKEFAAQLLGKQAASPSQAYRVITGAAPAVVLWSAFSSKSAALQAKFQSFSNEWPQSRQKIPYVLMQEMRITPDLPGYEALLGSLFFALMDGTLETPEAMRAFLEPHSPPAPPPPVSLRRPRAAKGPKKESRPSKARKRTAVAADLSQGAPEATAAAPAEADKVPPETDIRQRVQPAAPPAADGKMPSRASAPDANVQRPAKKTVPSSSLNGASPRLVSGKEKPVRSASAATNKRKTPAPPKRGASGSTGGQKLRKPIAAKKAPPRKIGVAQKRRSAATAPARTADRRRGAAAPRAAKKATRTTAKAVSKSARQASASKPSRPKLKNPKSKAKPVTKRSTKKR